MGAGSVLVSGAGVAGESLAVLLSRSGWDVTVVERAAGLRRGGQTVDLRGAARGVVERMGLLDQARALRVPQAGVAWVDGSGRRLAAMPVEAFGGEGFVSRDEIERGDLVGLLHDTAGPGVPHLFDDTIVALDDRPEEPGVHVTFEHAPSRTFDVVVGADGVRSTVRRLAFVPDASAVRPSGLRHVWFSVAPEVDLDGWFLLHNAPGCRMASLRPTRTGDRHLAGLGFRSVQRDDPRDRAAQLALIDTTFAGVGWHVPRLLEQAASAPDFAMAIDCQVHLPSWVTGRVAIVGDAAYCPSPLSGQGTAIALIGADLLAGSLGGGVDGVTAGRVSAALARYQSVVAPFVERAQRLPPGRHASFAPRTERGIAINARIMNGIQRWPVAQALEWLARRSGDDAHAA